MMRYMLDTNAIIELLGDATSKLAQRVRREEPADLALCTIVVHELFYGALKNQQRTLH
jgi:tRNA(fMet)-specific endonuclease VapC